MTIIFNKQEAKSNRLRLRANMPRAEVLLWMKLKGKQLGGLKFRRQYSIGSYVVDFCCPSTRLIVEVDGDTHLGKVAGLKDADRQSAIEAVGYRVVRVLNTDVYNNIEGVLEHILHAATSEDGHHPRTPPL